MDASNHPFELLERTNRLWLRNDKDVVVYVVLYLAVRVVAKAEDYLF